MARKPQVWAIRTKNWVELRKGAEPRLKTSTAVLETRVRHLGRSQFYWYAPYAAYTEVPGQERFVKRKTTLKTAIHVGGRPFHWVPYRRFSRVVGALKSGAYMAVPMDRLDSLR